MRARRIDGLVTVVLLFVLVVLMAGFIIPVSVSGARAAFCGVGKCIVTCEGTNCHCGHIEENYAECYCNEMYNMLVCAG